MMKLFLFLFSYMFLSVARCDLPIHAVMNDVYGIWNISHTKNWSENPQTCGGQIPNRNLDNLRPDLQHYKSYLNKKYGDTSDMMVDLTIEKTKIVNKMKPRDNWTYLAVRNVNTNQIIGHWTMVYDQGLEIRVNDTKYFGFFKYDRNRSGSCPKTLADAYITDEEKQCYSTDPSRLQIGWVSKEESGKMLWGCFYAEKKESKHLPASSYVIHNPKQERMHKDSDEENTSEGYKNIPSVSAKRASYKKVRISNEPKEQEEQTTDIRNVFQQKEKSSYPCPKRDYMNIKVQLNLPKEFSWGDPYTTENFQDDVDEQLECGSCYSITSVFSLQKRFEIAFLRTYKKNVKLPKFSYQSILSCSPFNQGCDGGYPYLVGKHMYEFGVTTNKCMEYANTDEDHLCKMQIGDFTSNGSKGDRMTQRRKESSKGNPESKQKSDCDDTFYASDYNYVSGCYECTNDYDMMQEILMNGPIVVAINAKPNLLNFYRADKSTIYDLITHEHSVCDIPDKGFNGWQYTNHAVNIVGWGEESIKEGSKDVRKYWIIRNTWGNDWGYKGYLKFQRGINLAGIESQAVYIEPDFTRGKPLELLNEFISKN